MNPDTLPDLFGPAIYTDTRTVAVARGFQVELTETAQEAEIPFPAPDGDGFHFRAQCVTVLKACSCSR